MYMDFKSVPAQLMLAGCFQKKFYQVDPVSSYSSFVFYRIYVGVPF